MSLLFAVILGVMLFCAPAGAQEDYVGMATSGLQEVLSNLKQSVDKLSSDNDRLAARDNAMKQQILQLQGQLDRLEEQEELLKKSAVQLQDKNPRRAEQITRLEKEDADLDDRTRQAEADIKTIQDSLDAGYKEDQKLTLQLQGMADAPEASAVESPGDLRQKEKLKLMKMIYESQQRQASLQEAISKLQKNTSLTPAADALAQQQSLKEQIKDLEAQAAPAASGPAEALNDAQLSQLQLELKTLEENYSQFKDLMGQMGQKAKKTALMTSGQHDEEEKLQGNIDDLNRQGVKLRADLDNLRFQMIDLDKRKSRLEATIQQLP